MAVLKNLNDGGSVILRARHRFGRSRTNHTPLVAPEVSGDHGLIGFVGHQWELRDLGSRNGSWVNGSELPAGARHPLAVGDQIGFGTAVPQYEVTSVAPPSASARSGDLLIEGDGDLLALPSLDDPQWVARYDPEEGWVSDQGAVAEGTELTLGGRVWVLGLPEILAPTREVRDTDLSLGLASLSFAVSSDEEYVEVEVRSGGAIQQLPPKAHHYLLLTLARAYQADRADGVADGEAGWRHTEDVQKMLRASKNQIYVGVHRIKKELTALGYLDGDSIVERRKTTQQLRIGVSAIEIRGL